MRPSWRADSGSSLLGTLLSLLACLLLSLPLLDCLGSAWSSARSSMERARGMAASAKADAALRALAFRVRPPWWTALGKDCFRPGRATLPWLEGIRAGQALVSWEGNTLSLWEESILVSRIAGITGFRIEPLPSGAGKPASPARGFSASWRAGGRDWECRAAFGAQPLGAKP